MNWILPLLLGAAGGLGIFLLIWEFAPSNPALASAITRLEGSRRVEVVLEDSPSLTSRLGVWAQRRFAGEDIPGLTAKEQDLNVLGKQRHILLGEKVLGAVFGFLFTPLLLWLFGQLGLSLPLWIVLGATVVMVLVGWMLPDFLIRDQADEARDDFARSASAYLDMISIGRISGMMANEALTAAAQVSNNWAFQRINGALNRARWSGVRPWDSIDQLKEEIGVTELGDVADIMRLSGEGGAQIYETLRGRARSLRSAQLAREHSKANQESERMTIPMTLTSILILVVVAYPAVVRLLA